MDERLLLEVQGIAAQLDKIQKSINVIEGILIVSAFVGLAALWKFGY